MMPVRLAKVTVRAQEEEGEEEEMVRFSVNLASVFKFPPPIVSPNLCGVGHLIALNNHLVTSNEKPIG